jgi:hypothetical protein
MPLDSLISAMNDMRLVEKPNATDLRRLCKVGCRELTVLADDDAFQALIASQHANSPEVDRVLNDASRFGAFINVEARELTEAGLDPNLATALLGDVAELRQSLRQVQTNRTDLQRGLCQLRDQVCDLAATLTDASVSVDRSHAAKKSLRRVAWVVGGAVIVGVNSAATATLGAIWTSVSITVGGNLVIFGIRGG